MRLNVKSRTQHKEEDTRDQWQEWRPLQDHQSQPQPRSRSATRQLAERAHIFALDWKGSLSQYDPPSSVSPQSAAADHRPSSTITNEIYVQHGDTRDSMVDNLLSTFDLLPEGSATYPSHSPFVPPLGSHFSSRPDSPQHTPHTPSHHHHTGRTSIGSEEDGSVIPERFDPYSIRTTPIREQDSARNPTAGDRLFTHFDMESEEAVSSRFISSTDVKHGRKKSKSSNKSLETTGKVSSSSPSATRSQNSTSVQGPTVSDKASRRRSRTGPGTPSILDRARPIPSEFHDFNRRAPVAHDFGSGRGSTALNDRPTIFHRGSDNPSADENFKHQISSRNKVAALTGSDNISFSRRDSPKDSSDFTATSSRQPSVQMLSASANRTTSSSPNLMRSQPSVDASKGKQGFFKRVFGSSKPATARPGTPTYQLPPITTGTPLSSQPSTLQLQSDDTSKASSISKPSSSTFGQAVPRPPAVPSSEPPHVVHKKTSFFRRRKKSVSDNLATDTSTSEQSTKNVPAAVSSATSLRQAMGPFLQEDHQERDQTPVEREHAALKSPTETVFHESLEQQAREGKEEPVFAFAPASPQSTPKEPTAPVASIPSTAENLDTNNEPRGSSDSFDLAAPPPIAKHSPYRGPSDFVSSSKESATVVQTASPVVKSMSPVLEAQASTSHPNHRRISSSTNQRSASSAAQMTGQAMPDDRSDEDWVDTTPFRRPDAPEKPAKPTRIRIDPETEGIIASRDRSPSAPSSRPQTAVRPQMSPFLSAQNVPTVKVGDSKVADSVDGPTWTAIGSDDQELARKLFNEHEDPAVQLNAATLLGLVNKEALRHGYLGMFDFASINILMGLRDLCRRLALKGETQQVDRIIAVFASRWCECNPQHGFRSADVVHTICYSILLLNTDLHVADVEHKMTRQQFVKNTLSTVTTLAGMDTDGRPSFAGSGSGSRSPVPWRDAPSSSPTLDARPSIDGRLSARPSPRPTSEIAGVPGFASPSPHDGRSVEGADLLIASSAASSKTWESQLVTVLKEFYSSIRANRLPLHSALELQVQDQSSSSNNLSVNTGGLLRRAGSVVSKSGSDMGGGRRGSDMKSAPNTWNTRNRSKQRMMYHSSTFGSSTTSFDDSPIFSPSASSTWSRSLGKPPSGMSSDSLTSAFSHVDYGFAPSAGFASALSNAIIREEEGPAEEDPDNLPYLEDESLGLEGAPWAKEGMVKHKHDLEAAGKRSSNRNWQEAFAVIEKGRMRLFSFSTKSQKKRSAREGGGVVGGGNWMDNAEELDSFVLRQTLSRELPRPGYSKQRPHVFNLMLPNGGLHLFQVGTPEIAKEFASTANYWSARLSKEPLVGGVSNIEYGWSENILNTALLESRSDSASGSMRPPSSARIHSPTPSSSAISSRPSFQGSLRGASIDLSGRHAVRTPADKITLGTWTPPQQILKPSNMREEQQLEALKRYQQGVWEETNRHLEFRGPMELAFTSRGTNHAKAMHNWQRKAQFLQAEYQKFGFYTDALEAAAEARRKVYEDREERKRPVVIED